jgi:hypothetical protein
VHFQVLGLPQVPVLFEACAVDRPAAGNPAVVGHRSPSFLNRGPVLVGAVVVEVVAAVVFRIHRCAAEVVASFRADLVVGDLG